MHTIRAAQRQAWRHLFASRPQSYRQLYQFIQPTFRTRTGAYIPTRAISSPSRVSTSRFARILQQAKFRSPRRFNSTAPAQEEHLSLSQRLKKLSREYGWSALYVYLLLTALDFPFCFLAVRWLGTDRIGHWEHVIVSTIKEWIKWPVVETPAQKDVENAGAKGDQVIKTPLKEARGAENEVRVLEEDETYVDHGYKAAEKANSGSNASLWTQLALAYAIHKSFIFVRVPLTAALTPKIVKTLRGWGWKIGPPKRPKSGTSSTGVNTKGSGVKPDG